MQSRSLLSLRTISFLTKYIPKTMSTLNTPTQTPAQPSQPKTYRMPQPQVIDFFYPDVPIRLHNYRVLLYANKQNLLTPAMLQCQFAVPFFALIYLIRYNPWYLTFPASLPIMFGLQIAVFTRWILHKRFFKYMVQRVYVYQDNHVEFIFSNKIRRKFKGMIENMIFMGPDDLKTPSTTGPTGQVEWFHKGTPFPTQLVYSKNQKTGEIECMPATTPLGYGWTKYSSAYQNYIFPKKYQYANWQLLVPLFNGRYIDFQQSTNITHQIPQGQNMVELQQQLKWLKQDQTIYQGLIAERPKQSIKDKVV